MHAHTCVGYREGLRSYELEVRGASSVADGEGFALHISQHLGHFGEAEDAIAQVHTSYMHTTCMLHAYYMHTTCIHFFGEAEGRHRAVRSAKPNLNPTPKPSRR